MSDGRRMFERRLLLKRFLMEDVEIYRIGKELGLNRMNKYDEKCMRHQKFGEYFFISYEEKDQIIDEIAKSISDEGLIEIFARSNPKDWLGIGFKGRFYIYEENKGLTISDASEAVKEDVLESLSQVGERGYAFLKAIIELHDEGKWNGDYYGATYADILAKMREILGKPLLPAPRDFPIFASYRIYFKSGSRKHPTHSIPEERIDSVREALDDWRRTHVAQE